MDEKVKNKKNYLNKKIENINTENKNILLKKESTKNYLENKEIETVFVNCPSCRQMIELLNGCYFITCISIGCLGKRYFCYVCKQKLEPSEKTSHFPEGPYNYSCKNKN